MGNSNLKSLNPYKPGVCLLNTHKLTLDVTQQTRRPLGAFTLNQIIKRHVTLDAPIIKSGIA